MIQVFIPNCHTLSVIILFTNIMKNKNNQRETDADGGTYLYLWLILTNCVKGWERLTYNRLRSCKRTFKSAE